MQDYAQQCTTDVGKVSEPRERLTESPEDKRGEVARIWLYFVGQHNLQLQQGELEMYLKWSNDDPPEQWEFTRNERIRLKQGNGNPFVEMFAEE